MQVWHSWPIWPSRGRSRRLWVIAAVVCAEFSWKPGIAFQPDSQGQSSGESIMKSTRVTVGFAGSLLVGLTTTAGFRDDQHAKTATDLLCREPAAALV